VIKTLNAFFIYLLGGFFPLLVNQAKPVFGSWPFLV
jgi:hypothetical protein